MSTLAALPCTGHGFEERVWPVLDVWGRLASLLSPSADGSEAGAWPSTLESGERSGA